MIATLRRAGLIALAAGLIAGPALADSLDNAGPSQAAGSTAYSGSTRSPSGLDSAGASDMAHSVGAVPDQDHSIDANHLTNGAAPVQPRDHAPGRSITGQ